ncbi:hypothetical protein [Microbacterium soli]|uniref:HNH endonuclease n=1 Tax=Microbacterium soli TaxID=446075 RepID=A0ABP7NIX6_9MICO
MRAGEFAAKTVRHAFFEREREACFRCRRPLRFEDRGIGWSAHHRIPRGSGGIGAKKGSPYELLISGIANCLILCGSGTTGCHGWVEAHRELARDHGLLILRLGIERSPAGIRVKRLDGTWWLLTSGGLAVECEEGMGR